MRTFLESVNLNNTKDLNTLTAPIIVYFKVTGCCNLMCSFCSQTDLKKKNMDIDKAKKLLSELKETGVVSINYTGGEPLVYPKILELVKYGNELGFEQTLVTNGINLLKNEEVLKYINTIGISLHGKPDIHDKLCNKKGTFKLIENNIDTIQKNYPKILININCTLTKENINEKNILFLKDFCKKKNIKLCFGRLNYLGLASKNEIINPNDYLSLIHNIKNEYSNISISNCVASCTCDEKYKYLNHACGAGTTIFSIEPNGDVKICPSSKYILGNAFEQKFNKIIKKSELKNYKKLNWLPNVCRICKDFEHCKGGCHAEGNYKFYQNTCDALLIDKLQRVWEIIENQKVILKTTKLRKEKNKYLIIKIPLRKIDKSGYEVLKSINGSISCKELVEKFNKIENIKDFLCTLYIEGIIGVKNEKKTNRK